MSSVRQEGLPTGTHLSSWRSRRQRLRAAPVSQLNAKQGHIYFGAGEDVLLVSNRLGCIGSLLFSAIATIGLLFLFGLIRF